MFLSTARSRRESRLRIEARLATIATPHPSLSPRAEHVQERLDRYVGGAPAAARIPDLQSARHRHVEPAPIATRILLTLGRGIA